MTELDIIYVIIPIILSAGALATTIINSMKKADADQVQAVASEFKDLQRRLARLEGRQEERDNKGAV